MHITHRYYILPALLTLGCPVAFAKVEPTPASASEALTEASAEESAAAEAPVSAAALSKAPQEITEETQESDEEDSFAEEEDSAASVPDSDALLTESEDEEDEAGHGEGELSPLDAPEDSSVALPYFPSRPLPDVFAHWERVLMAASEPSKLLHVEPGEALSEEEQQEVAEARQHVKEALDAARALFQAQMDLIQGPLFHPLFYVEDLEKELAACEAYLAESFRRDLEALSFQNSFLPAGWVEPSTRPGREPVQSPSDLESLLWLRTMANSTVGVECTLATLHLDWMANQKRFMERYLAYYGDRNGDIYASDCDPFTGLRGIENTEIPVSAPNGATPARTTDYSTAMRALIRREHRAWKRYLTAMGNLVCPCRGYRGTGQGTAILVYQESLLDSRQRFLYLLASGSEQLDHLSPRPCEREAALQPLHGAHVFGEIFTDSAFIFRHPKLEGHPWCINFPRAGAGFIMLKDNDVLRQYTADNPEGGHIEARGYQTIESTGEPFEMPQQETLCPSEKKVAAKPEGAMQLQQVFYLLECQPENNDRDEL